MKKKFIQSLGRGVEILEYLASNPNSKLQDISEALELNKSTLHSLISTLEQLGYVEKNTSSPRYSLGVKLYQLGRVYEKEFQIKKSVKPILEGLQKFSGETTYFSLKIGRKYLYIDKCQSDKNLKLDPEIGREESIDINSAIGKVYKAYEEKKILEYALDLEEVEAGMNCIAFPLLKEGYLQGVIGIGGPAGRLPREKMEKIAEKWKQIMDEERDF